jgi:hypothetical protein
MKPTVALLALACLVLPAKAETIEDRHASELAVKVENHSTPELCAERDNVDLEFSSPLVRQFQIQAVHPAYIGTIISDRAAADFTSCHMESDPKFAADAKAVTLWQTPDFWLTGYTYPSFWRPAKVPFKVGDKVENGLHLVQLWMRYRDRAEEVLVVYPPDGYWRARPLPFGDLRWTAYGSSFLIGPVEMQERPIVDFKDISFDPATKTFTLNFVRGGSATLKVSKIDDERIVLDVAYQGDLPKDLPFATMRSMYTTETNADVAKVDWRVKDGKGWSESPVMAFPGGDNVTELWAGRTVPSRHNTSAPDMVFGRFEK